LIRKITISVLIVILALASAFFLFLFSYHPASTPPMTSTGDFSAVDPKNSIDGYDEYNISQGSTFAVNFTLSSLTTYQLTLPITLQVSGFSSDTISDNWNGSDVNYSALQERTFNYSLSLNEVTLQPNSSNSTIITFNIAKDAPTGEYRIAVNTREPFGAGTVITEYNFKIIVYRA
jgi:hypothetical protein